MARCGRCGLWNTYPSDHSEQKWAGVCLWYHIRLHESEVYEHRECPEFLEQVPTKDAGWHFTHIVTRNKLADAYNSSQIGNRRAKIAIALSSTSLFWNFIKFCLS